MMSFYVWDVILYHNLICFMRNKNIGTHDAAALGKNMAKTMLVLEVVMCVACKK